MTGATTALLCQQCTTGRVESFNINREWRPRKRLCSVWKAHSPRTGLSVRASSSVTSGTTEEEPTIDELLSKLEQGTPAPASAAAAATATATAPAAAAAAAAQRRRPGAVAAPRARTFTVPDEELVVDKVLTGRVKAIMTFGAFVDMGARLDGLLHISKLGAGFVKNVEDVLQVGQEIQVQIIEADLVNRRIKLKRYDPNPQPEPVRTSPTGPPRERGKIAGRGAQQARRTEQPKTNYQKGQTVTGVVKNLTRRGCFVELPSGEEGFMHANEISAIGESAPIETLIKVGQEVKVRVLRIIEGRLNLSMKEELDIKKINEEMNVNMFATNAFELAFRKDPAIRKYLQDSGKIPTAAAGVKTKEAEATDNVVEAASEDPVSEAEKEDDAATEDAIKDELATEETDKAAFLDGDVQKEQAAAEAEVAEVPEEKAAEAKIAEEEEPETKIAEEEAPEAKIAEEEDTKEEIVSAEENEIPAASAESQQDEEVAAPEETHETDVVREETSGAVTETVVAEDEVNKNAGNENVKEDVQVDVKGTPEVSSSSAAALAISAALVKELRQQSGAGMMDCKKALVETQGNFEQAIEYLRKKGLAGADKKASRVAAEGAIGSYIHDGRIGVLLEVNCETDFVSRGELFTQLVEDLGMQIAACQQVEYISTEEVPEEVRKKEFEIEMQREDLQNKPEGIRAKIVEGRVAKRFGELALLEQAFVKNDSIIIKDLVRQTSASVGEKIQVRRFTRYVLGEGLEKRSYDIASEVAAQAKAQEEQQHKEKETKEVEVTDVAEAKDSDTSQGAQVTISAVLVKQLREETGTGMMDCKKALVECKGSFEEAKEYLRKKGLASAEKKAGRIAAEGLVVSYIHASRVGVLLELNCETDFVARNSVFKELAEDLAMQVVACPQVGYVSVDDIPSAIKDKERELEMQREDLQSKPEQIRSKIVEGRLNKLLAERALMEQAYLKDDTVLVKDLVTKTTVSLGENIRVRRFVRYILGEGIEKKSHNLAEEIAALQST